MSKVGFRMENNTFKGSLFGGFNREDVIDYIKKTSAESTARIESLEGDIDKLCAQEQELRTQVSTLRGENDRLTQEHSDTAAERDTLRAALDTANDELTALRAEAEALRAENASLRAENDKLRPMAEQYSTIKEHLAGIELDAHQRAEEYERGVHERLATMIGDCRAHCDSVLSTLGNTCINVTGELRRAENSISSLPAAFNELRAGLEKLEVDK